MQKMGKKGPGQNNPEKEENEKTRGQQAARSKPLRTSMKGGCKETSRHSFAPLSNLNSFVKNRQNKIAIELMNFINSIAKNSNFAFFLRIFDEFLSEFRAKFQKIVTCVAFSIKFEKTNQKFAENFEFCENYSLLFKIIHWCP